MSTDDEESDDLFNDCRGFCWAMQLLLLVLLAVVVISPLFFLE